MLCTPEEPTWHRAAEVIDLTLSDSDDSDDHDDSDCLGFEDVPKTHLHQKSRLPLRPISSNLLAAKSARHAQPGKKRKRQDNPYYPGITFLSCKRLRRGYGHADKLYPNGVLKSVRIFGHARPEDITLPEVLQVDKLDQAILGAYLIDVHWLMGEMGLAAVDTLLVADSKGGASNQLGTKGYTPGYPRLHYHYPKTRGPYSCMHGKLMLLFRDDGWLRIVVPSANLLRLEWGAAPAACGEPIKSSTDTVDNTVFLVDLPLDTQKDTRQSPEIPFERELLLYLERQGICPTVRARVQRYGFDDCKPFAFVHTDGPRAPSSGMDSLARAVRDLDLRPPPGADVDVEYHTSSLGRLSLAFMDDVWRAIYGGPRQVPAARLKDPLRGVVVRYPSEDTVMRAPNRDRRFHVRAAIAPKDSEYEEILRACLHDLETGSFVSHAKYIRACWAGQGGAVQRGWMLSGSHNLTPAAWMRQNYECSVLFGFPPCDLADGQGAVAIDVELSDPQPHHKYGPKGMWWGSSVTKRAPPKRALL